MDARHTTVWLDHHEAKIFHIGPEAFAAERLKLGAHIHRHAKGVGSEPDRHEDERRFFHDVAHAIEEAGEVLIVGPGTAKLAFLRHVREHDRAVEPKIVGIETVDHPSDGQLVAYARRYFDRVDRMRGHA